MSADNRVFLDKCERYSTADIVGYLEKSFRLFDSFPSLAGAKVLLKPNLISSRNCRLSCTHPCVIEGVATWLVDHGAKVSVGDSPAFGSAFSILNKLGSAKRLSSLGIGIVEFRKRRPVSLSSGRMLVMAAEPFEYDLLVNLPKIKAHDQLYMTMAVKNFFGLVKGIHKAILHMSLGHSRESFASLLLEILSFLPPNLSIADGIEMMHRHGPMTGSCLSVGVMAASVNPIALDTAMLAMLELNPLKSPVHIEALRRKMSGSELSELSFPLLDPASLRCPSFIAPSELIPLRFHPFRFLASTIRRTVLNR